MLTAQAWAANASLASIRSRSLTVQPAFSSAFLEAGIGPVPMIEGSTPACAQETMRASGVMPALLGFRQRHQHHGGGAVVDAAGVGRRSRCRPCRRRAAAWRCSSSVTPSLMYSSSATTVSPLRVLMVTGTISSLNLPAFLAASALFCEATAKLVLLLARDLPLAGDVLGRGAHVVAVEGVPQAVLDHGVDELDVAHLGAVAQVRAVRRLAHALLAAGDDDRWRSRAGSAGRRARPRAGPSRTAGSCPRPARRPGCRRRSRPGAPGSGPRRRSGSGPG